MRCTDVYTDDAEHVNLLALTAIQSYLTAHNPQYINHYLDNTVDTLLDSFYYLTITFSRKLRGEIHCDAVTFWGEIFHATGQNHLSAGCKAIYKLLRNIDGKIKLDYYQQYL